MKNSTKKQTIERLQAALLDALDENKALKMQCDQAQASLFEVMEKAA